MPARPRPCCSRRTTIASADAGGDLTPKLDHRAGSGVVASRIGLSAEGVAFDRDADLELLISNDISRHGKLDCVLVDEAQFLTRSQVWQLSEVVDQLRIPVLCYAGLRTDFRGELFEGSQYLLAWADELTGNQNHLPHRQEGDHDRTRGCAGSGGAQDGPQVEIGGNERYVVGQPRRVQEDRARRRQYRSAADAVSFYGPPGQFRRLGRRCQLHSPNDNQVLQWC